MSDTDLLTQQELGELLEVPQSTIKYWRHAGGGPDYIKVGRHVRYRRAAVEAWLTESTRTARAAG